MRLFLVIGLLLLAGAPALAQPLAERPRRLIPPCEDSSSARYRDRVLIVLEYGGANYREMWAAVRLASEGAKVCIVSLNDRPLPDSALYGRLRINALTGGGYEIATEFGGPRAHRSPCTSPRAAVVSGDVPIFWGVLLSGVVRRFVPCLVETRARLPAPP